MILYIKNMVSHRCKMIVEQELNKLEIKYFSVKLGEIKLQERLNQAIYKNLELVLKKIGLGIIKDKKSLLIEKMIHLIIDKIYNSTDDTKFNFSEYLTKNLYYNYHYLAELFSKKKGITIEHFIILHKVERIKELIMYNEMNLTEISYIMHYSSVSHLSKQFKKTTGLTPSFFRNMEQKKRSNIEDL